MEVRIGLAAKCWKVMFSLKKRKRKSRNVPEPIFRILQNSRGIPSSAFETRRESAMFHSFVRMLNKVRAVLNSRRTKKRNLYERLADTVNEMEKDGQKLDEKVSVLKDPATTGSKANKSQEQSR